MARMAADVFAAGHHAPQCQDALRVLRTGGRGGRSTGPKSNAEAPNDNVRIS